MWRAIHCGPKRLLIDYVDVDSDKWRQYAQSKSGIARLIYSREASTLLKFDREGRIRGRSVQFRFAARSSTGLRTSHLNWPKSRRRFQMASILSSFSPAAQEETPLTEFGAGPNFCYDRPYGLLAQY